MLLLPEKSPKPRARVYYAIMLVCETVAYPEDYIMFLCDHAIYAIMLLGRGGEKTKEPRVQAHGGVEAWRCDANLLICETVA